jgi:alpha-L-glutamate ligase-like protein
MFGLFRAARRLRELGILGMNRRNAAYILDHNPRAGYPVVDDKMRMHRLCGQIGVPTPRVFVEITRYGQLRELARLLAPCQDFVLKPNCGSAGRGVLVLMGRAPCPAEAQRVAMGSRGEGGAHETDRFVRHNGELLPLDDLRQHLSDILSGLYSLGGQPDTALVQQRIRLHPAFSKVAYKGIPDVRVIVYRGEPAMAMLRLPTKESNGRANLHQGGIGTGVDLETGITNHAVQRNRLVERHPDTGLPVVGLEVPYWNEILQMSRCVARAVGLGYIGVDIVVDEIEGPLLLEANARPGLAIQIANGRGLLPRLEEIDAMLDRPTLLPLPLPVSQKQGEERVRQSA